MNFDRTVNFITHTDGSGYWTELAKTVRINRVELAYVDDEDSFGELRAYFDKKEWDVDNDGLIYSDRGWMASFLSCMATLGFSVQALSDINYSEQGMQGDNFVSMDVGREFIQETTPMYRFVVNKEPVNT